MKRLKAKFKQNYYQIDIPKTIEWLKSTAMPGSTVKYINDFPIDEKASPTAVFYVSKPNRAIGHMNYVHLFNSQYGMLVSGSDADVIEKHAEVSAARCLECRDVVYSKGRHHVETCTCGNINVDGGDAYFKLSFRPGSKYRTLKINLLTNKITKA